MSAKLRGYQNMALEGEDVRVNNPNDFYQTPELVVHSAIKIMRKLVRFPLPTYHNILDLCAGNGVWGNVAREYFPKAHITGVELNPQFTKPQRFDRWVTGDARHFDDFRDYHLVLSNPPYGRSEGVVNRNLAEQVIMNQFNRLNHGGVLIALLKLPWLEGEGRAERLFHNKRHPQLVAVSSRRIPWKISTHGKRTNTVSYALYFWVKGNYTPTRLTWFDWKDGSHVPFDV